MKPYGCVGGEEVIVIIINYASLMWHECVIQGRVVEV